MDKPLSYGDGKSNARGGYQCLLVILDEDPRNPITELKTSPDRYSHEQIARIIYRCGTSVPTTITNPLMRKGAFLPALGLGFARIHDNKGPIRDDILLVVALMERMMRKMEIHIVPWAKGDQVTNRASPTRGDWWLKIRYTGSSNAQKQLHEDPANQQVIQVQHALDRNTDAPWSMPGLLKDMGPLWTKCRLPSQWGLEHASLPGTQSGDENHYMKETYEYVKDEYDGNIWWHHMGLVWALMFSRMAPYLCVPKNIKLQESQSIPRMSQEIQQLSWVKSVSKSHRGMTSPMPFITMMSTTIISLLDARSPLRRRMADNNSNMGAVWTKKHGIVNICAIGNTTNIVLSGHKEIHAINMVRMGLAKCLKPGLIRTPNYGSNWEMKTLDELRPLYNKVIGFLKTTKHGEYLAFKEVFGEEAAIRVAMNGDMEVPAFVTAEQKNNIVRSN